MEFRASRLRASMINMTPLVDVVFLMLVFFLLTSSFVRYRSVELDFVDLRAAPRSADPSLIIRLSDTDLTLDGVVVNVNEITSLVLARIQEDPALPALVLVSETVQLQSLVVVLDAVRGAGVVDIRLGGLEGQG